jgi:hypothetical protein
MQARKRRTRPQRTFDFNAKRLPIWAPFASDFVQSFWVGRLFDECAIVGGNRACWLIQEQT